MKTRLRLLSGLAVFLSVAVVGLSQDAPKKIPRFAAPGTTLAKRPLQTLTGGDTCASPPTVISTLPFADTGDTTGAGNDVATTTAACGSGFTGADGPDLIYQFTVGAGNSLTITVTPTAAWDVKIYLLSICGDPTSCVAGADVAFDGGAETITPAGLAPGTYFLYVDSFFPSPAVNRQGPYNLSVTGTFGAVLPTATNTPTVTSTNTPTVTQTVTGTPPPSSTPTTTPTITLTPVGPTSTPTATATVVAATATPTSTATVVPATPTPTPTVTTAGGGPGHGPSSPVPTLSGWMLAFFAVLLAGTGLLIGRRN